MNRFALVTISLTVFASSSAFAQSKTRAEVYRELFDAQHNGLIAAGKTPSGMSSTTAN